MMHEKMAMHGVGQSHPGQSTHLSYNCAMRSTRSGRQRLTALTANRLCRQPCRQGLTRKPTTTCRNLTALTAFLLQQHATRR